MEVLRTENWCIINIQELGNSAEIINAVRFAQSIMSEYYAKKVTIKFSKPSRIYSRKRNLSVETYDVGLFLHEDNIAYTTTGRSGQYVTCGMDYLNITSIEIANPYSDVVKKEADEKRRKFINRVLNARYNDVTWSNLNENSLLSSKGSFYNISKIFDSWDMDRIKKAFENKEKIHIKQDSKKRDYSVETKLCEDGVFKAWFSSEFTGCCNGSYYLLLNPTMAVHCEDD